MDEVVVGSADGVEVEEEELEVVREARMVGKAS